MRVVPVNLTHPDALALLDALSDTLGAITGDSGRNSFDPADVTGPGAAFVVAYTSSGMRSVAEHIDRLPMVLQN